MFLALNGVDRRMPTFSGVVGYAAGIVLHYFLSRRFVFDAARSPKAAHRLFAEFVGERPRRPRRDGRVSSRWRPASFGLAPIAAKVLAAGASFVGVFLIRRTIVFA